MILGWIVLALLIQAGESRHLVKTSSSESSPAHDTPASSKSSKHDILLGDTQEMLEIPRLLKEINAIISDALQPKEVGRRKRNSPFSPPQTCQATEEELQFLLTALSKSPQNARQVASPSVNLNEVTNQRCTQLVKIKDGINNLMRKLNELTQSASLGSKYLELKREYEQELIDLKRLIEDEKRQANQEAKFKYDMLLTKYQELKVKLGEVLANYELEKKSHIYTKVQLCVSKIKAKDYDTARRIFRDIQDNAQIPVIVSTAYTLGVSRRVITYFFDTLSIFQVALGKIALYDEALKHSPYDSSPRDLKKLLVKIMCGLNYSNDRSEVMEFCKKHGQAYNEFTSLPNLLTDLKTFKDVDRNFYF